jgi:hypothetical protein
MAAMGTPMKALAPAVRMPTPAAMANIVLREFMY